jgi:hypothetical protein
MLIVLGFLVFLIGCDGFLPTNTDTTEPMTTVTTATTTTTTMTTAEQEPLVDAYYQNLMALFPIEITTDYQLPVIVQDGFSVQYFLEEVLLVDNILPYEANYYSTELEVTLSITYQDFTKTYLFEVIQKRDESLYQQYLIDEKFNEVFSLITENIPETLYSDFTLPLLEMSSVQVTYSTDDCEIINNRLIYNFPETNETIYLEITVKFNLETRTVVMPLLMVTYEVLPNIAEIRIVTDYSVPIETKEEYVYGYLDLYDYDEHNNSQLILGGTRMRIKLRGNSTLYMPKKAYKIKFDEAQYMLSDYAEKEWVLLANFADQTLLRNALAYQMGQDLGMDFAPMVRFVDVYINGVYQGNYLLTDQVEVSSNRVDVEEKSTDIDTGYLIEYDMRIYDEGLDMTEENYFLVGGVPFVIKSPDIEDDHYSHDQYVFIRNYVQEVYDTLVAKEDYTDLIDEASFIDWFIVSEIFKNVDSGYSSVYFHKEKGGLLKMGPLWDFDLSSGNYGHLQEDLRGPEGWYTSRSDKNVFFYHLMQYESFRNNLKARWNEVFQDAIIKMIESIYPMSDMITKSRYYNFMTWDIIGTYEDWFISPEILALDTYHKQLEFLRDFLIARVNWLNTEINLF